MRRPLLVSVMLLAGTVIPGLAGETTTSSARANYILHCSGCHGMSGAGTVEGGIPAFPNSVGHIAGSELGRTYITHVPGVVSTEMEDAEIAEVLNYILDEWSDGGQHFTAKEVTRRRAENVGDVVELRREVVEELKRAGVEIADYPWP